MFLSRLTLITFFLLTFFSCKTKNSTTHSPSSTTYSSISDFLKHEMEFTKVDFDLVNKNLKLLGTSPKDPDAMTTTELDAQLVREGVAHLQEKKYSDCVSKVAQITLSAPLFSTAQYVNAFAFFKQNKLERAAEIFGGMFQYESMYKNLNREELGWMNVYTRYLMFQNDESDIQKKALDNAIDLYFKNIENSEGVFYNKVNTLKGFLKNEVMK